MTNANQNFLGNHKKKKKRHIDGLEVDHHRLENIAQICNILQIAKIANELLTKNGKDV